MNKFWTILFLVITYLAQAQELPSEPVNSFVFPAGSKFVVKLIPTKAKNYDFTVLSIEPFDEIVDKWKLGELFEKEGEENTIVFYFCLGTEGETLLLMKNYSDKALHYDLEIQLEKNGEFKSASNGGIFSSGTGMVTWSSMIYNIKLKKFRTPKR